MPQYRRYIQSNSCYYFTVVTHNRNAIVTTTATIHGLQDTFRTVRKKYPFAIDWKGSSFRRYVKLSWYDKNWGNPESGDRIDTCVGE